MPENARGVAVFVDVTAIIADEGAPPIHLDLPDDADLTVEQAATLQDGLRAATDAVARVRARAFGEEPF